jgi:hypothetical protein
MKRMPMLVLALWTVGVLLPSRARAAEEVRLSYAEMQQLCSSCGQLVGQVEVKNLAYTKQVALVYSFGDGVWREAAAGYAGPAAGGAETWAFSVTATYGATVRFALRYRVAGQEYWDNNGGADYRIGGTAPAFLLGSAAVKLDRAHYDSSRLGYYVSGTVVVKNLAYAKEVKVVYSFDDWASAQEAFASYEGEVANSGGAAERWSWVLPVPPPGNAIRFAIAYTVNGVTYWDNNLGQNHTLTPGQLFN